MAGWSKQKRTAVEKGFYDFLNFCYVNSKDSGRICLGKNLYMGQRWFITTVFDALERDIHKVYVLKARQLGLSTIARAMTMFLLSVHDGLKGAIVFDTEANKLEARAEIVVMINDLPRSLRFPMIVGDNRSGLTLENDSKVLFMAAGVSKRKTSGTLGRSVGLSLAHMSELCSYDNDEGLEAFEQSLSEENPDRLYIYESTARGFNIWHDRWAEARQDTDHCVCLFLGWWSKPSQRIDTNQPDWERYGVQPPTEKELEKIKAVRENYNYQITPEQLAWVRRKMDPGARPEGDAPVEYEGSVVRIQEQPWTESDSFQMTGAVFFAPEKLTDQANLNVSKVFKTYMFGTGIEFTDTHVYPAPNSRSIELKVWEEPVTDAVYVISCDPAFGSNEFNDRSAIQVLRCYADGLDQVAEYAWPLTGTKPLAWIILALCGWYSEKGADIYLLVELNGPGAAVWDELTYLRHHIAVGYQPKEIEEKGLKNVFQNVKNYIYTRPDAMTSGRSWQWKTTSGAGPSGKVRLMERLRDFTDNGMLKIRSLETLEEMRSVTREGDVIGAQGKKKDDRTVALALGVRCWEERCRKALTVQRRTREYEAARRRLTIQDQAMLYTQHQLENFFRNKHSERVAMDSMLRRAASGWRSSGRRFR
jgi:hypothetical protein